MNHFRTLHTEYISNHRYFTARKDGYETPAGKIVDPYFVVEMPDAAVAMAITEDNKVVLINQYRHPIGQMSVELPGGFIDAGEKPEEAIARELSEETGYKFSDFHYLGKTYSNPGVLSNASYMFLATGGKKAAEQKLDDNEEIEVLFKSLDEVRQMLMAGEFKQSMHSLLLFYAFGFMDSRTEQI